MGMGSMADTHGAVQIEPAFHVVQGFLTDTAGVGGGAGGFQTLLLLLLSRWVRFSHYYSTNVCIYLAHFKQQDKKPLGPVNFYTNKNGSSVLPRFNNNNNDRY